MKHLGNIENNNWITQVVEQVMSKEGMLRPKQGGIQMETKENVSGKKQLMLVMILLRCTFKCLIKTIYK